MTNAPENAHDDVLDDLFDDAGMADIFKEVDTNMDPIKPTKKGATDKNGAGKKRGADDLGIDETIKVRKKRINVKLDEERLLSEPGIPKLRRTAKEKLHFKGKGHEFSDVARLLAFYQLWLDDLFPKAKFADGLAIIEKLGHSRRMQVMRREWIEEGKAKDGGREEQLAGTAGASRVLPSSTEKEVEPRADVETESTGLDGIDQARAQTPPTNPADDLYSATPRRLRPDGNPADSSPNHDTLETAPEEDELDALLAQDAVAKMVEGRSAPSAPQTQMKAKASSIAGDDFDDDLEALAELEGF